MAKYRREFLVPYLRDLCSLELIHMRLDGELDTARSEMYKARRTLDAWNNQETPAYPVKAEKPSGGFAVIMTFISCILVIILLGEGGDAPSIAYFFTICSVVATIISIVSVLTKEDDIEDQYELEKQEYIAQIEENKIKTEEATRQITCWISTQQEYQQELQNELAKVEGLLKKAYAVNVIPGNQHTYRNVYAVYYLYEWFKNNRVADDLDMAINTFVLEQIKAKLDIVIQQQSQSLINQSIMIANQERLMDSIEEFKEQTRKQLCQIQATQEEQSMYMEMMDTHIQANAYFAAANYLKTQ